MPGRFFVFEGLDGSGKSTQCRLLTEALRQRGYTVHLTREPTDGPWGQKIRELAQSGHRVSPQQELDWFIQDRKEHIQTLHTPAFARGEIVVQDRYFLSSMAYQGSRGLDPDAICALHLEFAPLPDLTFLLDLPPQIGLARVQKRQAIPDAFEQIEALEKCANIFAQIELQGLQRLDGQLPLEILHASILTMTLKSLKEETKE